MIYDKQFSFYLKGNEQLIKFESSNKYIRILKKFIYENINPNTFKNILDWLLAEMFWAFIDFHYYHYYYTYTFFAFDDNNVDDDDGWPGPRRYKASLPCQQSCQICEGREVTILTGVVRSLHRNYWILGGHNTNWSGWSGHFMECAKGQQEQLTHPIW